MMWGNTVYCVELSAEGLSRYANEIELFASRKYPYIAIDITITTRNRKHRRAAAKPAACAKPLMLSTPGSKGKRGGRVR